MKLHNTNLKIRKKTKQRIGRGGKRGSYSGRGTKGQKSRAGRKLRPAQRDLIMRLPKLRGFRNKLKKEKPLIFNLKDISRISGDLKSNPSNTLNIGFFVERGILSSGYNGEIKILSQGEIKIPLTIEGIAVSKKAKEKIEKAGGSVKE